MTAEQPKTLDDRAAEILAAGQAKTIQEAKLLARKEQLQAEVERTKKSLSDYRAKLRKKAAERRRKRETRGKIVLGAAILKAGLAEIDYDTEDEKQIIRFNHGYNENLLMKLLTSFSNPASSHLFNIGMAVINSLRKDNSGNYVLHEKGFPLIMVTDELENSLKAFAIATTMHQE